MKKQPEQDVDLEILVNAVVAARSAANAADAALRNWLKKRAAGPSGGATERPVPPTFMARARRMVHDNAPEGTEDDRQAAGNGGGIGREQSGGHGSEDDSRGDSAVSENSEGSHLQQG